jgi:hypothetical protein
LERRPAVLNGRALREAVKRPSGVPVAVSRPGEAAQPIDNPVFR